MNAARYWHTVRYLRPRQVVDRLRHRAHRPSADLRPAPPLRHAARCWRAHTWREPSLFGPTTVRFLEREGQVATQTDWQGPGQSLLWTYNLHYFDDLSARGARQRRPWHRELVRRWVAENPPGGTRGWDPYPLSLRLVNWIKWVLTDGEAEVLDPVMAHSMAVQARWLAKRLEKHLLANHFWTNAKALLLAGLFFDGAEAARWCRDAAAIVSDEIDEQVLADGGHFERSPMYHAIVLEDVLDLVQAADVYPGIIDAGLVERLRRAVAPMLRWLRVMSHPDGEIAFFNDAAMGIAPTHRMLSAYAASLDIPGDTSVLSAIEPLLESGYVRLEDERAVIICDVAPVGPDYQPAHAHADTLSFELSLDGRRTIVNGGTSTYAAGEERQRQRSTAAHNTVEVDGNNSSDVWAAFRVGRRARPRDVSSGRAANGSLFVRGTHDGYRAFPGCLHTRTWKLDAAGLTVTDAVDGRYSTAVSRLLFAPGTAHDGSVTVSAEPPGGSWQPAFWHPRFGVSLPTEVLVVPIADGRLTTRVQWSEGGHSR